MNFSTGLVTDVLSDPEISLLIHGVFSALMVSFGNRFSILADVHLTMLKKTHCIEGTHKPKLASAQGPLKVFCVENNRFFAVC